MPYCPRDVLARKFRQNWLNKFSDVRYSTFIDKEIDDSLTNLNWLPNISLSKLTSQSMPLSPTLDSYLECNKYLDLKQSFNQDGNAFSDLACTWDQLDDSAKQFYKIHITGKPPFSQLSLICMAIQDIGQSRITLGQICEWIMGNFPYYQIQDDTWQHTVKNLLSISKCFQKVPRRKDEPDKGAFWRLSGDYQKHLTMSSVGISNRSSHSMPTKTVNSSHNSFECYGTSSQYLYSLSKINSIDSGHGSTLSSGSKRNSKCNSSGAFFNYNSTSHNQQRSHYMNQIKRHKSRGRSSLNQFGVHSSYSQFQQHLNSSFFHECNSHNRFCTPNNFYMNPTAMSTPIRSNSGSISTNFPHYPYLPINGRSRNRAILNNEHFYSSINYGSNRVSPASRQASSYVNRSHADSNYESRTSSIQQSNNSAFSSFRNLIHKRSYQFSVRSPNCRQLSQLSNSFSYLDHLDCHKPINYSSSNEELYHCLKYIDTSDISISYSSSDQLLINPESIKHEAIFNDIPEHDTQSISETSFRAIKDESKLTSCNWWTQSQFDSSAIDNLQSCEKIEPTVSSPFEGFDKDQQWVDAELNLEELDSILGLS